MQECETKIAREIASLSKEDVSKEEMNENEEVINILLAQVVHVYSVFTLFYFCKHGTKTFEWDPYLIVMQKMFNKLIYRSFLYHMNG